MAMQRTRREILNILKHRGKATVEELAHEVKLSSMTVRAHVAILQREGLVRFEEVGGAVGRPAYAYSLTDKAEESFPNSYALMVNLLIDEIVRHGGATEVNRYFRAIGERIAAERIERLGGTELPEIVGAVARTLDDLGSMATWEESSGKFYIHQFNCPYLQVARRQDYACHLDLCLVSRMLETADVERVSRLVAGDSVCTYVITPRKQPSEDLPEGRPVTGTGAH